MSLATTFLHVDLAAAANNYAQIVSRLAPGTRAGAAVKANAYGTGMDRMIPALEAAGCDLFFVANLSEAEAARRYTKAQIAVLSGAGNADEVAFCKNAHITPILNSPAQMRAVLDHAPDLPVILHIDTGMNRLGVTRDELAAMIANGDIGRINLQTVMSHFACADEDGHPLNTAQHERFDHALRNVRAATSNKIWGSLANSSGIYRDPAYHYDIVRPGMAIYGLNPTPERPNPMTPVVRLDACVLQIHTVKAGETAGYGATYTAGKDSVFVVLGIGYADGFPRILSNRGHVYWHGIPCPIAGRVSMDLTIVDIGHLPHTVPPPVPGDKMEIIGPHQDADTLAAAAGTIGYEILTSLSRRADRGF